MQQRMEDKGSKKSYADLVLLLTNRAKQREVTVGDQVTKETLALQAYNPSLGKKKKEKKTEKKAEKTKKKKTKKKATKQKSKQNKKQNKKQKKKKKHKHKSIKSSSESAETESEEEIEDDSDEGSGGESEVPLSAVLEGDEAVITCPRLDTKNLYAERELVKRFDYGWARGHVVRYFPGEKERNCEMHWHDEAAGCNRDQLLKRNEYYHGDGDDAQIGSWFFVAVE